MCYGLESEPKAISKYEIATTTRVSTTGFQVNPEFPFRGCTPDGLVGNDTVVEIKALKIFKQYSVEKVTCRNSPVPRKVLGRQCFKVEDWNCVLKHTHAYYYQCQQILLATARKCCDLILHAATGPDSVERIPRGEPFIKRIMYFLTALWMLVTAPEVFEMRAPMNLLPFVLAEPSKSLHSSKQSPLESPDCGVIPGDPITCTSSFESVEQFAAPKCTSPTAAMDPVTPAACSPASYPDLCGTIESDLVEECIQPSLYYQEEIDAAEALLSAASVVSSASKSASEQGQKLTVFPWGGLTSTGISLTNTCPLDN